MGAATGAAKTDYERIATRGEATSVSSLKGYQFEFWRSRCWSHV